MIDSTSNSIFIIHQSTKRLNLYKIEIGQQLLSTLQNPKWVEGKWAYHKYEKVIPYLVSTEILAASPYLCNKFLQS